MASTGNPTPSRPRTTGSFESQFPNGTDWWNIAPQSGGVSQPPVEQSVEPSTAPGGTLDPGYVPEGNQSLQGTMGDMPEPPQEFVQLINEALMDALRGPQEKPQTRGQKALGITKGILSGIFIARNPQLASTVIGNRTARRGQDLEAQATERGQAIQRGNLAANLAGMYQQKPGEMYDFFEKELVNPDGSKSIQSFARHKLTGQVFPLQDLGQSELPPKKELRGFTQDVWDPAAGAMRSYRFAEDPATGKITGMIDLGSGKPISMDTRDFEIMTPQGMPMRFRDTINPLTGQTVARETIGLVPTNKTLVQSNKGFYLKDTTTGALEGPLKDANGDILYGEPSNAAVESAGKVASLRLLLDDAEKAFAEYLYDEEGNIKRGRGERGIKSFALGLPFGVGDAIDEFFISYIDPETSDLANKLQNISDILTRVRSGAQVSVVEIRRLRNLLPKLGQSPEVAFRNFARFETELMALLRSKARLQPGLFTDEFLNDIGLTKDDIFGSGTKVDAKGTYAGRTLNRSDLGDVPQEEIDRFIAGGGTVVEDEHAQDY